MAVNKPSLDLIVEFEDLRTVAYPDPAHGWAVPTIGVGHTSAAGPPKVFKGQTITKDEAYQILERDLVSVEKTVDRLVKVPMNPNQRGAVVSFTFNLGEGNLAKSTMLKKLNASDYAGAAAEFPKWNKAAGKVMAGLTRRRVAEARLFMTPVTGVTHGPPPVVAPPPVTVPSETKPQTWGVLIAIVGPILYGVGKFFGIV